MRISDWSSDVCSSDLIVEVSPARAVELVPILRLEAVGRAAYEEGVLDMDVHGIHHGFLRGLAARGGKVVNDARVEAIERKAGRWELRAGGETYAAPVVVNAAGAWADEIGRQIGRANVWTPVTNAQLVCSLL